MSSGSWMTVMSATGSIMSSQTSWHARIKRLKAEILRRGRDLPSRRRDCRMFINDGREFWRSLLFCCLKEWKWQRHNREPELWLLLFDRQAWRLPFTSLWRERLGRKIQRQSVKLKKKIHRHINNINKSRPHLLGKEMSLQTCLEIYFQSTLYIESQEQNVASYRPLIKSKHPQVWLESVCSYRWCCNIKKNTKEDKQMCPKIKIDHWNQL